MTADYEFKSDFALRNQTIGRAEGEAKGEAKALLIVLESRGIGVSEKVRDRILACRDQEQLDEWLVRAVTAESVEELFD